MSYLVLARKWRPSIFEQVVGQEHITRTLSNAIRLDRVAHAFLFTGARGVGKTSTARIFAKALNCEHGPTPEPCGTCQSCLEVPAGTSIDVFEIDGASNRGIGEIRDLRDGIKYAPSRDRFKIYIIDEVHMLTQEAFNALLKTLEEPPAHVKFIFATTEPQKIPVTILSRCQRFDFKRVPSANLIAYVRELLGAEGVEMDEEALHIVARESEGSVRDALSLLDRIISFAGKQATGQQVSEILGVADRRWMHDLVAAMFQGDAGRAVAIVNDVHQYGFDIQHFAAELARFLRDLVVIRVSGEGERLTDLSASEYDALSKLGTQRSPDELLRMFRVGVKAAEEVAHSRFPKLVLEMAVIRLSATRPLQPLDELLGRLEELEKRLPDGFMVRSEGQAPPPTQPRGEAGPRPALRVVPPPDEPAQRVEPTVRTSSDGGGATHAAVAARPVERPREPAPAPSPQRQPVTSKSVPLFESWLRREDQPLFGDLSQARLSETDGVLEVEFKNEFNAERFRDGSADSARLRAAVDRFFAPGTRFVVRLDRTVETTYERRERQYKLRVEQKRAEAQRHPAVVAVVEAFEGQIRNVVPHESSLTAAYEDDEQGDGA